MLLLKSRSIDVKTRTDYTKTLTYFRRWLDSTHPGILPEDVGRDHVVGWMAHMQEIPEGRDEPRLSRVTVGNRYRHLQQWFRYLVESAEIHEVSPMHGLRPPKQKKKTVPVIEPDELMLLLKDCEGKDFVSRRDTAILLLLMDTGIRRGECSGIDLADLNMRTQRVRIEGKGDRERWVPFGISTALAIDKYRRARSSHPDADLDALWLSYRQTGQRLTPEGIHQMLKRRAKSAGVPKIHAHRFRHTMAHNWLNDEGSETDLMAIAGWETTQMLRRYTDAKKSDRAAQAHRTHGLADKLLRDQRPRKGRTQRNGA